MPDFAIERGCAGVVCGVDEAGRGPLAGPVVAAAVVIDRRRFRGALRGELDDSKALSRDAREAVIARCGNAREAARSASGSERRASARSTASTSCAPASRRWGGRSRRSAIESRISRWSTAMSRRRCHARSHRHQGRRAVAFRSPPRRLSPRSTRDRIMTGLSPRYPGYGWDTNVGYGTPEHGEGLRRHGVTPHHRRSFEPVRLALNPLGRGRSACST